MAPRHELKYSISLDTAKRLFADLRRFCVPDPFTGEKGWYEVSSLYYDTDDFRFYWDREESVGYRRKVRVRSYNGDDGCDGMFLEIKEKHRNLVSKKRLSLPVCIQRDEPRHDRIPLERFMSACEDSSGLREIGYLNRSLGLYPIAIVRYLRDILISERDKGLRITFDRRLTTGGHDLFGYEWNREEFIHDPNMGILEVKANVAVPLWLTTILAEYELTQSRFSKYCLAVRCLYGAVPKFKGIPDQSVVGETQEELPLQEVGGL